MMEQINGAIKDAMKAKDKTKLDALRYFKGILTENQTSKSPKTEMDVLISHVKKLKDSLEHFKEKPETHVKLVAEITVLEEYMPKQLSQDEVNAMIEKVISNMENPQMGLVMKELTPQTKGRFEGKLLSQMVREKLS